MVHGCEQTRCILQKTAPHQTVHWRMGKTWRSQKVQENETSQNTLHPIESQHDNKQTPSKGCFFSAACYQRYYQYKIPLSSWFHDFCFQFIGLKIKKTNKINPHKEFLWKFWSKCCNWIVVTSEIGPPPPLLIKKAVFIIMSWTRPSKFWRCWRCWSPKLYAWKQPSQNHLWENFCSSNGS